MTVSPSLLPVYPACAGSIHQRQTIAECRTRSTLKKLQGIHIPVFVPASDHVSLVELSQEVATVGTQIARTDALIDQIVYRLYGLTDEEVAIVEGVS